ncbi:MAG: glycosyltransferase involved in cell wall biosynthesis/ActR [Akkermansiaceae bacterium]|jgi:glycosyltransferase involved in cell wall biosynthesis/ActR/RegA family two-component response regulator
MKTSPSLNSSKPSLSFLIPLMNEEASLKELYDRIAEQAHEHSSGWEIIFIDDGSTDSSWDVVQELAEQDTEHVRAIRFRSNQGKAPALAAGYAEVSGEIVFTLDADLQDDPKEIPRFLEKLNEGEGWDIVSGYKAKRHDPWHKVLPSRVFNLMLSKVNGVKLHDHNCGFKCYRLEVVQSLPMYGEMHRMVPSLASIEGYRTTEIIVEHHPRVHGVSKYGVKRFLRGFMDMWTVHFIKNFRERPLHLMGGVAILCVMLSVFLWVLALIPVIPEGLRAGLLSAAPAALFAAPILVMIGFLGELITHRHYAKEHPLPIVDRIEPLTAEVRSKVTSISSLSEAREKGEKAKPKILVADDDSTLRRLSTLILGEEGFEIVTVDTAEAAMAAINADFDAVLLDIYLPGLSGIEALPKLKTLAPYAQVVILSGSEQVKDGADAIKAGAFDFLSKPIQRDELTETLGRAVKASRALRPVMHTTKVALPKATQ